MATAFMEAPAQRVARTYYLIAGVYTLSASLIWGVNTMFLLSAGLSLMQAFLANAIFTGSMALFEVPTGIVADTRGRRASFLLSVALLIIGTLAYVAVGKFGGGMAGIVAASVVLGLGYTFYSGAVEAWLVDALRASGYTDPVDRVLARGSAISSIAMLVVSVAGGLLGGIDLSVPYLVRSALLIAAFGIGYRAMHDSGFTVRAVRWGEVPREMSRVGRESLRFGWREKHARLAILAGLRGADPDHEQHDAGDRCDVSCHFPSLLFPRHHRRDRPDAGAGRTTTLDRQAGWPGQRQAAPARRPQGVFLGAGAESAVLQRRRPDRHLAAWGGIVQGGRQRFMASH